ncbi:MAG: HEAT repeat domain-containing protein [Desulfovibrio sp.]|nr:MAG: HEAT repeat domain-containing protein [Desulfovibrio sp.]
MANTSATPERDEILAQLRSNDVGTIRDGAFSAGQAKCVEAVPVLIELLGGENLGVQEAADMALRQIGGPEVVKSAMPLLRSDEAPVRNTAMDLLREVGQEDLESLIALIKDNDPDIRIFVSDILGSSDSLMAVQPLCHALLQDPEVNVRYQAAVSLGELGRSEAAQCLNKALSDEEWVQFSVIEALVKIRDESSVSALVKAMDSSSDLVGSMIVDALGEMGNVKAVGKLLKRMDDSPTALRNKIVKAVVTILGGRSLTLLSELEREKFHDYLLIAMRDEDMEVQDAAMSGLCHMGGEQATAEVVSLGGKLDPSRDQERLEQVIGCLATMGINPALESAIREGTWKESLIAVRAAGVIGDSALAGVILEVFEQKDRDLQRVCVETLVKIAGPEQEPFFLNLLETHDDGEILRMAVRFVGVTLRSQVLGPTLFSLLSHPYDDVKEAALDGCVAIGGPDMNARFRELFQSEDPMDRFLATHALGRLGVADNLEQIKLALVDEVPDIRKAAVETFSDVCVDDKYLPLLLPVLDDEHQEVRLAVVEMLGLCTGEETVPHLERALEDEDGWVKIRALEALAERGVKTAVPAIIPMLASENKILVLKVVEALGAIGGQSAFRALLDLLGRDDPELTSAAEDAVAKLKDRQGEAM